MKEICLHQWIRPERYFPQRGTGDCTTCEADERNKECAMYTPIIVIFVEVVNEKNIIGYI